MAVNKIKRKNYKDITIKFRKKSEIYCVSKRHAGCLKSDCEK